MTFKSSNRNIQFFPIYHPLNNTEREDLIQKSYQYGIINSDVPGCGDVRFLLRRPKTDSDSKALHPDS